MAKPTSFGGRNQQNRRLSSRLAQRATSFMFVSYAAESLGQPIGRRWAQRLLIEQQDCLLFTTDVEFTSPSAAATVIRGGNSNGLTTWKNAKGKTLKEIQSVS